MTPTQLLTLLTVALAPLLFMAPLLTPNSATMNELVSIYFQVFGPPSYLAIHAATGYASLCDAVAASEHVFFSTSATNIERVAKDRYIQPELAPDLELRDLAIRLHTTQDKAEIRQLIELNSFYLLVTIQVLLGMAMEELDIAICALRAVKNDNELFDSEHLANAWVALEVKASLVTKIASVTIDLDRAVRLIYPKRVVAATFAYPAMRSQLTCF
ncbi:hypothetical protein LTR17_020947 [Elasticomyces elasticus]|nr:hypothetical protein LTR17_020947 [Elasticomyces elasticus]